MRLDAFSGSLKAPAMMKKEGFATSFLAKLISKVESERGLLLKKVAS